tara:strand:+ start:234 stop:431 length:198 start_codon:yes stop_codon:yes gene_type:complete
MPGHFWDELTETVVDLDEAPEYCGYRSIKQTSLDEWYGCQDPVEQERKRLNKEHGYYPGKYMIDG